MPVPARPRLERPHPAAVVVLLLLVVEAAVLLAGSDVHGTGASSARGTPTDVTSSAPCPPTVSTAGGDNNYRPGAPAGVPLGGGMTITGLVRDTDCRPLPGVRVQVWLQTATASEREHRTAVRTGPDGRFRVESDPTRSQFGEPNVHVAHDARGSGEDRVYDPVFVRHVLDADDPLAVIDLVLRPTADGAR